MSKILSNFNTLFIEFLSQSKFPKINNIINNSAIDNEFVKASEEFNEISFYRANCTTDPEVCDFFSISVTPFLTLFHENRSHTNSFCGRRNAFEMMHFARINTRKPTVLLKDVEFADVLNYQSILNKGGCQIWMYPHIWIDHQAKSLEILYQLNKVFQADENVHFVEVITDSNESFFQYWPNVWANVSTLINSSISFYCPHEHIGLFNKNNFTHIPFISSFEEGFNLINDFCHTNRTITGELETNYGVNSTLEDLFLDNSTRSIALNTSNRMYSILFKRINNKGFDIIEQELQDSINHYTNTKMSYSLKDKLKIKINILQSLQSRISISNNFTSSTTLPESPSYEQSNNE